MKKTILLITLAAFVISCGGGENKGATAGDKAAEKKAADPTKNPDYQKGLELVAKSDCFTCHKVAEKVTGPSYQEVAKRYAGQQGIEDSLAQKIIKGGAGNWGSVPMTPHPNLSEDDARAMVKYILTLNQ